MLQREKFAKIVNGKSTYSCFIFFLNFLFQLGRNEDVPESGSGVHSLSFLSSSGHRFNKTLSNTFGTKILNPIHMSSYPYLFFIIWKPKENVLAQLAV
jgi:hypothetical protein